MNLQKAIEILTTSLQHGYQPEIEDLDDAVKLLIEAGKAIQLKREFDPSSAIGWLPGETIE